MRYWHQDVNGCDGCDKSEIKISLNINMRPNKVMPRAYNTGFRIYNGKKIRRKQQLALEDNDFISEIN